MRKPVRLKIIFRTETRLRCTAGREALMVVTTKGVILKRRSIGEQDAILTVLTDDLGVIEASARGVKRAKSKLAAAVQPFYYSELSLFHTKERYIVNNASAIETFHNLRYDVVKVALANYISELICYLAPSLEQVVQIKRFYLNSLYLLAGDKKSPRFIKAVSELRLMALSGFMPDLVCCHQCAAYKDVRFVFDLQQGFLLCENCHVPGKVGDFQVLTPSLLASLRHIIYSEDSKVFNFTASEATLALLSQTTERYVLCHLERSFRPLEIYRSLLSEEPLKQ